MCVCVCVCVCVCACVEEGRESEALVNIFIHVTLHNIRALLGLDVYTLSSDSLSLKLSSQISFGHPFQFSS